MNIPKWHTGQPARVPFFICGRAPRPRFPTFPQSTVPARLGDFFALRTPSLLDSGQASTAHDAGRQSRSGPYRSPQKSRLVRCSPAGHDFILRTPNVIAVQVFRSAPHGVDECPTGSHGFWSPQSKTYAETTGVGQIGQDTLLPNTPQ